MAENEKSNKEMLRLKFENWLTAKATHGNYTLYELSNDCAEMAIKFANYQCKKVNENIIAEITKLQEELYWCKEKHAQELAELNSIIQNTNDENPNFSEVVDLKRELYREKERVEEIKAKKFEEAKKQLDEFQEKYVGKKFTQEEKSAYEEFYDNRGLKNGMHKAVYKDLPKVTRPIAQMPIDPMPAPRCEPDIETYKKYLKYCSVIVDNDQTLDIF